MKQLAIYICDNFLPDYRALVHQQGCGDVEIRGFPCWCIRNSGLREFARRENEACAGRDEGRALICGLQCPLLKTELARDSWQKMTFTYCQECLTGYGRVQEIISGGAYVLSAGWLENWRERLAEAGFNRELARRLYSEGCRELVLLDTGFDRPEAKQQLEDLSAYLDRPGRIVEVGPNYAASLLCQLVRHWRHEAGISSAGGK